MPALHAFTDTAYGPHLRQRYDLFVPEAADKCPTVVCVPGGWWGSGDNHDLRGFALRLAEAGWAAASLGTRLLGKDVPSGKEIIDDVVAATQKIVDDATLYGADDRAVVLLGSGSGSLSALLTAAHLVNLRGCRLRVRAAVACGLTPAAHPWDGCPITTASILKGFASDHGAKMDASAVAADAWPPLLILHGENDAEVAMKHVLAFSKPIAAAGEICRSESIPGAAHQFIEAAFEKPARMALDRTVAFLKEVAASQIANVPSTP